MQVETLYPYLCTHTDKYAPGSVNPNRHTSASLTSEHNKWGKHQGCVAAARKHGSVLLPTGWCLSLLFTLSTSTHGGICKHSYHSFWLSLSLHVGCCKKNKLGLNLNWSAMKTVHSPPTDMTPHSQCVNRMNICVCFPPMFHGQSGKKGK